MSTFRDAQRQAHPTKTNTLLLGVICVLILILVMQVWLLTAALNESLDGHNAVKWPAFWVSLVLFGSGAALLRYLKTDVAIWASRAIYESTLEAVQNGIRTTDFGGSASTTDFTDEVIRRVEGKLEVWDSLGR